LREQLINQEDEGRGLVLQTIKHRENLELFRKPGLNLALGNKRGAQAATCEFIPQIPTMSYIPRVQRDLTIRKTMIIVENAGFKGVDELMNEVRKALRLN